MCSNCILKLVFFSNYLFFSFPVESLSFKVPLVTDMTPDVPLGSQRYNGGGWQHGDDENAEVKEILQELSFD